ncbi:MAG: elongation factor G [Chloroflexota bacterium]
MAKYSTGQIRNVAFLGHSGSGKTTLTESLLNKTGAISRMGRVEDGSTVSDWDAEEQKRGISINLSVVPVEYKETKINILDTPGFLDFVGEIISALSVAEAALLVVDAQSGVEVGTELAWDRLGNTSKPTLFFINRMDRENADFQKAVDDIKETLADTNPVPLQMPIGHGEDFNGVINLVTGKAHTAGGDEVDIPAELADAVAEAQEAIMEAAAESDEELLDKYFEEGELTIEEIRRGLLTSVADRSLTPVFCGTAVSSSGSGIGMGQLLNALVEYVPPPSSNPVEATQGGETTELTSDGDGAAAAMVFKTIIDRYVGRMNYIRVFSGSISKDMNLHNPRGEHDSKIANLFSLRGKEINAEGELAAGDIGMISKLDNTLTGDTLTDKDANIVITPARYPTPLFSVAVAPATKADSAKVGQALSSIIEEDRTLTVENIRATKQTVLQGMGGTHVDIAINRLETVFGVKVTSAIPKVPYQETIKRNGQSQYRHRKQSGGAGQFAEVHMRVEPLDRGEGFEYASEVFGGAISQVFLPSIEKGVKSVMETGFIAGFPVVDVKAIVFDGKEHPVDSKDIAFQTAGREVFKLAMEEAAPVLLEPIYSVQVTVPDEYMGDVMGDFNTRRGRVQGMEQRNNRTVVNAMVPLAEIMRYDTDLRSMTQGRGFYSIEFDHYDPVPDHMMEDVIAKNKAMDEEE